jgi:hypothetical protein
MCGHPGQRYSNGELSINQFRTRLCALGPLNNASLCYVHTICQEFNWEKYHKFSRAWDTGKRILHSDPVSKMLQLHRLPTRFVSIHITPSTWSSYDLHLQTQSLPHRKQYTRLVVQSRIDNSSVPRINRKFSPGIFGGAFQDCLTLEINNEAVVLITLQYGTL